MELDLTEAIEAAAVALWGRVVPDVRLADVRKTADLAVRAAAPIIERAVRERVAAEVESRQIRITVSAGAVAVAEEIERGVLDELAAEIRRGRNA